MKARFWILVSAVAALGALLGLVSHRTERTTKAQRKFDRKFKRLVKDTKSVVDLWWQQKAAPVLAAHPSYSPEYGLAEDHFLDPPFGARADTEVSLRKLAYTAAAALVSDSLVEEFAQNIRAELDEESATQHLQTVQHRLKVRVERVQHLFANEGLDFADFREHVIYLRGQYPS